MDIASGFVFQAVRMGGRLGIPLVIIAVALLALAIIVSVAAVGLLQPESDPVLVAPFRWYGS